MTKKSINICSILAKCIVLPYHFDSYYQSTNTMPKDKIERVTIPGNRDIAHVYGILTRADRGTFRERMENRHGIPESTLFRLLRTNEIPTIKRNAMVDELNTILKSLGFYYDGKRDISPKTRK